MNVATKGDTVKPRLFAALAAVLVLAFAAPAAAQDDAYSFGNTTETYILGGLSGGGSFGSYGGGGYVGGELSLAFLKELLWGGVYIDGTYDFAHLASTFSVGPEFGFGPFGFDGGVAMRFGLEDEPEIGAHGRFLITLGTFALYGRYGYWPDAFEAVHIGQVGVLLKLPFWNSTPTGEIAP